MTVNAVKVSMPALTTTIFTLVDIAMAKDVRTAIIQASFMIPLAALNNSSAVRHEET